MTREEAKEIIEDLKYSLDISLIGTLEINEIDNAMVIAIKALEQQEKTAAMTRYTDGLEEGIRCAMCTNPMANDRGCDGGCVVNESMYQNVLNVIKKQILEQQPCEDAISRKDMLAIFRQSNSLSQAWNGFENLPSVTPKEKTGHWEYVQYDGNPNIGNLHCSECERIAGFEYNFCPNCGARMVGDTE